MAVCELEMYPSDAFEDSQSLTRPVAFYSDHHKTNRHM